MTPAVPALVRLERGGPCAYCRTKEPRGGTIPAATARQRRTPMVHLTVHHFRSLAGKSKCAEAVETRQRRPRFREAPIPTILLCRSPWVSGSGRSRRLSRKAWQVGRVPGLCWRSRWRSSGRWTGLCTRLWRRPRRRSWTGIFAGSQGRRTTRSCGWASPQHLPCGVAGMGVGRRWSRFSRSERLPLSSISGSSRWPVGGGRIARTQPSSRLESCRCRIRPPFLRATRLRRSRSPTPWAGTCPSWRCRFGCSPVVSPTRECTPVCTTRAMW